ncbi:uncharacterized protein TNCV_4566951 [Trichonephila clavipes]|nr:uncharacterized protein TNCV_4566951 [Trichonephila clavipes]
MCWSEGGQGNTFNQTLCGLDTLDLHLESWSGEQFPTIARAHSRLSQNTECKCIRQYGIIHPIVLPFMNSIQGRVFQQDNSGSHTTIDTQWALHGVDMLPWNMGSPDLSPVKHI